MREESIAPRKNAFMRFFHRMGSPKYFYEFSGKLAPWLGWSALVLMLAGLYGGLVKAPPDYQQGDSFRIIYIHVPSASMSMFVYVFMAVNAAIGIIWRIKISEILASSSAVAGACFTFLALVTGSLWGKPTWGAYWVWDARLTSELVLLFLYLGFIALQSSIEDPRAANRAAGILAIVGVINIPIIKWSVNWWNTLHQGATISKFSKPSMNTEMLIPLLIMIVAFQLYFFANLLIRCRREILEREKQSNWVQTLAEG